jgi:DHA2 family multidrug resistance protein-like MFS transporter
MTTTSNKGNDKLLFGIILGVLAFWLFAQTTLNINVVMAKDLQLESSMMNIAVSITSLFSGIFIVVMGGLADRMGRLKIIKIGFLFSIIGSLLVGLAPSGAMAAPVLISGRIFQGLSGACIMPASLALLKAYWDGASRQRAVSLWSMGSWGGSGFCALFGGLMAENIGWRYIFFASAVISLIGWWMTKSTPESKVQQSGEKKKPDVAGIFTFDRHDCTPGIGKQRKRIGLDKYGIVDTNYSDPGVRHRLFLHRKWQRIRLYRFQALQEFHLYRCNYFQLSA